MLTHFSRDFPALAGRLGKRNLPTLLVQARSATVAKGTVLIEDQGSVQDLFLVAEGVCRVEVEAKGRSLVLGRLGKGQWLGEVSLLGGAAAISRVTAETEVRLVAWPVGEIHRLRKEHPEVAGALVRELIDTLAERVRASDAELQMREGQLSLAGSDRVRIKSEEAGRSWLKRVLEKLTGTSPADPTLATDAVPSPEPHRSRPEGDQ